MFSGREDKCVRHGFHVPVFLTYQSNFGSAGDAGMYAGISDQAVYVEQGIWSIANKAALFFAAIALFLVFGFMMWYSNRPDKTKEAKRRVSKVCLLIILICSIAGILALIQEAAL